MKKWMGLRISLGVGLWLLSTGIPGFAFVTPEHYEKIKQEARGKQQPEEKVRPTPPPGTFQVHPPAESKPAPGGFRKK